MKRALITGISGLLAPYVAERFAADYEVLATSRTKGSLRCDLTDEVAVQTLVKEVKPDVVVHCAALTDVDYCEQHPKQAKLHNQKVVRYLADACPQNCQLIYISTDQVYPDTKGPHKESEASPINTYGKTKLAGENEALQHPLGVALRANMFGHSMRTKKQSLSDFYINSFKAGKQITLFNDIYFSPLSLTTLSNIIHMACKKQLTGVYNVGSREGKTKAAFAKLIAEHLELSTANAKSSPSTKLTDRAPRAKDLTMDVSQIEHALNLTMPTLAQEIRTL